MDKLLKLKEAVTAKASNPGFIHHQWYVKWHLQIVERLVNELCNIYTEADRNICLLLVWLHDYGKILDFDNQYETTLSAGRTKLTEIGFAPDFVDKAIGNIEILDKKMELDINQAPLEVQIVSSADGCSHMVGPFLNLWWYENANKLFTELMSDNLYKLNKDWTRKIVLPEARQAFEARYTMLRQQAGELPEKFLG